MAAIVASIDAMQEEGVIANADRIGRDVLGPGLGDLAGRHPMIGETRGLGVFHALELVEDPETRQPLGAETMAEIKQGLMQRGLLTFIAANRIHVVPPCNVTDSEVKQALEILDDTFTHLGSGAR